jgi:putative sigma-54 modulation protein
MDIQVRGHDIAITDGLRDFIDRRMSKLDHLLDRVVDAKLELRTSHNRAGGDVTAAQLTIQTGRIILRAEERDHDPHRAIDQVVDKMVRQIRRYRDKRGDHKAVRPEPAVELPLDVANDELPANGLVRTKRFITKPMDADEAIEQMELLGHDFFLFFNVAEDQMNVVYRRRDGSYGLLIPELH